MAGLPRVARAPTVDWHARRGRTSFPDGELRPPRGGLAAGCPDALARRGPEAVPRAPGAGEDGAEGRSASRRPGLAAQRGRDAPAAGRIRSADGLPSGKAGATSDLGPRSPSRWPGHPVAGATSTPDGEPMTAERNERSGTDAGGSMADGTRDPAVIRAGIEQARQEIEQSVAELRQGVAESFDWRNRVRRHPGPALGGAFALGLLLARWTVR